MVPAQLGAPLLYMALLRVLRMLVHLLRSPACQRQALTQQGLYELVHQQQSRPPPLQLWLESGLMLRALGSSAAERPAG